MKTIGEAVLAAKAAHPGSITVNGWVLTYLGEVDVSDIVAEIEKENP